MKRFLVTWFSLLSVMASAEWFPPENPKPKVILDEAKADAKEGRYDDALAKHVWYFQNALSFDKALYGVRLSFALNEWWNLALEYPPAMNAMHAMRDATEDEIRNSKPAEKVSFEIMQNDFQALHDVIALNERLSDSNRTAVFFQWLDEHQPERARQMFDVAERALIEAKAYKLCGKYLKPETDFARFYQSLTMHREMAKQPRFASMKDFGEQTFSAQTATLVGLLVLNDRADEAKTIRDRAVGLWDLKIFHDRLDEALAGKLPPPFPARN